MANIDGGPGLTDPLLLRPSGTTPLSNGGAPRTPGGRLLKRAQTLAAAGSALPPVVSPSGRRSPKTARTPTQGCLVAGVPDPQLECEDAASLGIGGCAVIAALSCFMGVTDGLSLGAIIFPSDHEHPNVEFKNLGMSLGLLTALVSNLLLWIFSGFHFAVGGAIIPMVAVMSNVFTAMGPAEPETILVSTGLVSLASGVLFFLTGCGLGVKQVINTCPFVVFGGFLAGTGATLFDFGFQLLVPGFTSLLDFTSDDGFSKLLTPEAVRLIAPPSLCAIAVFLTDRWGLLSRWPKAASFTLPITLVLIWGTFYAVLLGTGMSLEEARQEGWLFAVEIPKKLDFFNVWTKRDFSKVKWELVLTPPFFLGVIKAYLIGLLTLTKNVYGTQETTGVHDVDIDREIRLHGGICVLGGLLGALPGNLVMSFTCTAKKLGVPTTRGWFHPLLVFFSLLFFAFGDFAIAVMPKMVPGTVLLWLGIAFCAFWLYDAIGKVPVLEHLVVVLMTLVDMFLDAGSMIVMGLFCTLLLLAARLHGMQPCTKVTSLGKGADAGALLDGQQEVALVRSHVRRAEEAKGVLAEHGKETLVLFPRDLSFMACARIAQDLLARFEPGEAEGQQEMPRILIFMLDGQPSFGVHFVSMVSELAGLSKKHGFKLILAGVGDGPLQDLERYGMDPPLLRLTARKCHERPGPSILPGQVVIIAAAPPTPLQGEEGGRPEEAEEDDSLESLRILRPYCTAVELAENLTLAEWGPQQQETPAALVKLDHKTLEGEEVEFGASMTLNRVSARKAGVSEGNPAFPLAVHIHRWLNEYDKGYDPSMLPRIIGAVEVKELPKGAVIYDPEQVTAQEMLTSSGDPSKVPPLVWLLEGELEHFWMGTNWPTFSHFRAYEAQHGIPAEEKPLFEGGCVTAREAQLGHLIGPFSTLLGFQGAMPHVGQLKVAGPTKSTKVALLTRSAFERLLLGDPQAAVRVQIYLARFMFVSGCDPSLKVRM